MTYPVLFDIIVYSMGSMWICLKYSSHFVSFVPGLLLKASSSLILILLGRYHTSKTFQHSVLSHLFFFFYILNPISILSVRHIPF